MNNLGSIYEAQQAADHLREFHAAEMARATSEKRPAAEKMHAYLMFRAEELVSFLAAAALSKETSNG